MGDSATVACGAVVWHPLASRDIEMTTNKCFNFMLLKGNIPFFDPYLAYYCMCLTP
jgi:hypothetical protein